MFHAWNFSKTFSRGRQLLSTVGECSGSNVRRDARIAPDSCDVLTIETIEAIIVGEPLFPLSCHEYFSRRHRTKESSLILTLILKSLFLRTNIPYTNLHEGGFLALRRDGFVGTYINNLRSVVAVASSGEVIKVMVLKRCMEAHKLHPNLPTRGQTHFFMLCVPAAHNIDYVWQTDTWESFGMFSLVTLSRKW